MVSGAALTRFLPSYSTQEIYYSSKRQGFLVECVYVLLHPSSDSRSPLERRSLPVASVHSQGYAFKVITALEGIEDTEDLVYKTKSEQIELLQTVLLANESEADIGSDMRGSDLAPDFSQGGTPAPQSGRMDGAGKATRVVGSMQALAGYVSLSLPRLRRSSRTAADPSTFSTYLTEVKAWPTRSATPP
jgi:DNA excision repair protein ERCC-3